MYSLDKKDLFEQLKQYDIQKTNQPCILRLDVKCNGKLAGWFDLVSY